jgi:hypothetical protein
MAERREIKLAGVPLGVPRHVCAFFATKDEQFRVLLPFIKEGFEGVPHRGREAPRGSPRAAEAGGH